MKKSAIFLNLGRGPIVVEKDLKRALETDEIRAAGLDVLSEEPCAQTIRSAAFLTVTAFLLHLISHGQVSKRGQN